MLFHEDHDVPLRGAVTEERLWLAVVIHQVAAYIRAASRNRGPTGKVVRKFCHLPVIAHSELVIGCSKLHDRCLQRRKVDHLNLNLFYHSIDAIDESRTDKNCPTTALFPRPCLRYEASLGSWRFATSVCAVTCSISAITHSTLPSHLFGRHDTGVSREYCVPETEDCTPSPCSQWRVNATYNAA